MGVYFDNLLKEVSNFTGFAYLPVWSLGFGVSYDTAVVSTIKLTTSLTCACHFIILYDNPLIMSYDNDKYTKEQTKLHLSADFIVFDFR